MKNHFITSYAGNKREECKDIYTLCNFDNITTIVEPFCGSSAFSYYVSLNHPKKFKYILNDNNKHLIELYKILKDETLYNNFKLEVEKKVEIVKSSKDEYLKCVNSGTFIGWFIGQKYYNMRPALYPANKKRWNKLNDLYPIINFLRNEDVEFCNMDGKDIFEKYMNDTDKLIFLDPPYVATCNDFYEASNCNIYEFIFNNNPINLKSNIIFALENSWIIKLLLKELIDKCNVLLKDKIYQNTHKNTTHIYLTNKLKNN